MGKSIQVRCEETWPRHHASASPAEVATKSTSRKGKACPCANTVPPATTRTPGTAHFGAQRVHTQQFVVGAHRQADHVESTARDLVQQQFGLTHDVV
jgi:hypothetical protein